MEALWHRNSTIYQLDPSLFKDGNGDGHGDFIGLRTRLDHLRMLGADCLWLNPFYASPWRDGGYDVSDHLRIDPRFGDTPGFIAFIERAEQYGIRVIVELVVQHTSDQHLWFQDARHHRKSKYRDYYVWSDEPVETEFKPSFPGVEDSVWTWDEEAQQFYRHVFYSHEPDLDIANPAVRDEIRGIMAHWLRMGVCGFRIDAAPYMAMQAKKADPREDGLWWLDEMKTYVEQRNPLAILMGEADVGVHRYDEFFDEGRRLTWLLDFWLNNHAFLAFARGSAKPLVDAVEGRSAAPGDCSYAGWLRNHDQLDLDQLEPAERAEVLAAFAPDPDMRVYGHGIRRRLAPMFDGDPRRQAMAKALLFSLPGVPILRYGDEIGMGEDLSRPERLSVRTPMQWSAGRNAGFSAADADRLCVPVIDDARFGPQVVNVEAQLAERDSLLSRVQRLVRARQGLREITGKSAVLPVDADGVFALRYDDDESGSVALLLTNIGADGAQVTLNGFDAAGLVDVLGDQVYPAPEGSPAVVDIAGHGYRWLRSTEPNLRRER